MGINVEVLTSIKTGKKPKLIEWVASEPYPLGQAPNNLPNSVTHRPIETNCKRTRAEFNDGWMHHIGIKVGKKLIAIGSIQANEHSDGGLVGDVPGISGFGQLTQPTILAREGIIIQFTPLAGTACQRELETRTIK